MKFKVGDFVRIKAPPPPFDNHQCCYADPNLFGKIGTVQREMYDPEVYVLFRFTSYLVSIFGVGAICAEFCLELVPGEPDIEHEETKDEICV